MGVEGWGLGWGGGGKNRKSFPHFLFTTFCIPEFLEMPKYINTFEIADFQFSVFRHKVHHYFLFVLSKHGERKNG